MTDMPNIGTVLSYNLTKAGIGSPDELRALGAELAFIRLRAVDPGACMHALLALEGAVQGIRKFGIDPARKQELNDFYKMLWKSGK